MAIKVKAAASLRNGLVTTNVPNIQSLIEAFKLNYPQYEDVEFEVEFGSSGKLARDVVEDPTICDIFLSASSEAMDIIDPPSGTSLIVPGSRLDFIANKLVIVEKDGSDLEGTVRSFADVNANTIPGVRIWLANPYEPDFVPAGIYTETALKAVEHWGFAYGKALTDNTLGADVEITGDGVKDDDVPVIGIVYNSTAVNKSLLNILANATSDIDNLIIYQKVQVAQSPANLDNDAILAFLAFLGNVMGDTALNILVANGFRSLTPLEKTED